MVFLSPNIGIDVGSKFTKIVILKKDKYKYYSLLTPDNCVNNGRIVDVDKLASSIKDFFKKNRIKGQLCFSLSCSDIIIREIYMPRMSEAELKNAVRFEAGKYIPMLSDDYIVDYKVLGEIDNGLRVLLVACPRSTIDGYLNLAVKLRMKIKAVDIFPNAVIKAIKFFKSLTDDPMALIDMGHKYTKILIAERGVYGFYREILFGSENVALLLANKYNIDLNTADEKLTKGDYDIIQMDGFFDSLLREIDTVFNYYYTHFRKDISYIYLSGGLSNIKGLDGVIKDYFNIEIKYFSSEDMKYILPALGAALRGC